MHCTARSAGAAPSGDALVEDVSIGVGGLAAAMGAAMLVAFKRARKRRRKDVYHELQGAEEWKTRLLAAEEGGGALGAAMASGDVCSERAHAQSELAALRSSPGFAPDFVAESGAPRNTHARRMCVLQWRAAEAGSVRELPFSDVRGATDGFSDLCVIADRQGGSCLVYNGLLFGMRVVVKKLLDTAHGEGGAVGAMLAGNAQRFAVEMKTCCSVSHPNICSLYAFANNGPQRCLVLEVCAGGPLDKRLACQPGASARPPLTWQARVNIAVGVVRALAHLHAQEPPLFHRDVASKNVLLSEDDQAKVADFGLVFEAPLLASGKTHFTVKLAVGTRGYMPPGEFVCAA